MFRLILYLFLFLKIIFVSSEGNSSLVFVIDDTRSMKYDISQVRKEVDSIMDIVLDEKASQIKDIVLVTFNDPTAKLRKITNNRNLIKAALRSIKVGNYDNHDCPEASLEGIKLALENSSPNSYIYVFTDATAHNVETYDIIERMCQFTQSQVTFVLTGDCGSIHTPGYRVYNKIAAVTGGQVYRVDKDEVNQVLNTLKEMIKGKKAAIISQNVPKSNEYVEIPFTIDDKTEYAIVSASGKNVMLKLRGPQLNTKKLMWTRNSKVVKIIDPVPGDYVVKVKGSESPNIVVYGRTDFTFTPGFSEFLPKKFDDTAKQPVADTENHLSIQVEDPEHEVIIESAQILDMDGNIIKKIPLIQKQDFYYTRNVFRSPDTLFHIAVLGKVEKTGGSIKRITSVPIQPQIPPPFVPDTAPTVSIKEGLKIQSNYSGDVVLTCDIVGKPNPTIIWKDSKGRNQQFESFLRLVPNVFVSYLRLNKVKEPETYECIASNILGTNKASIHVDVTPPFTVNSRPSGRVSIPYGTDKTFTCDITSISSMDLAWYITKNTGDTLIEPSGKYVISPDKKQLTIKSMDADLEGKYFCKAWLAEDNSTNTQLDVATVTTDGLLPPIIDKTIKTVTVKEGEPVTLNCRVVSGIPKALITWLHQDPSSPETYEAEFTEVDIPNVDVNDNILSINDSVMGLSGKYKCVANNSVGADEHIIELIVKGKPVVNIYKNSVTLNYGTADNVICDVIANPKPKIEWKDDMGDVIVDSSHQQETGMFHIEYALEMIVGSGVGVRHFYCYAENDQGVGFGKLTVQMLSPLHVGKEPEEPILLEYGKQATLYCNITSNYPMLIKWYKINKETNRKELVNDPDKFALLADRSELRIHYTDMDLIGQYICESELLHDKAVKGVYKMNVAIKDMGALEIEKTPEVVEVKENEIAIIPCKLLKGVPPPTMTWEFMKQGSVSYKRISGAGQYLRIARANLDDAGRFRCIAKNDFGKDEKITDLIVFKPPVVNIVEGTKVILKYGGLLILTCKVITHEKPNITWVDQIGNIREAKDIMQVSKFEYRTILGKNNMKESITYTCKAENSQGVGNAKVEVSVGPSIKPTSPLPETTNVEHGKSAVIPCSIDSDSPIKRTWYWLNNSTGIKEPIVPSDKIKISADGKNLTINSMDMELEGEYSCEGVLVADANEKKELKTNLKVTGLVAPEIDKSVATVKVFENDTAVIKCIIQKGAPRPTITWQYKTSDTKEFVIFERTDEILEFKRAAINYSAVYRCKVTNVAGFDEHETELIVQKQPVIVIENDTLSYTGVLGDVLLRIPCKAIGNPKPVITWQKDDTEIVPDKKILIEDGALIINEPVEDDSDEYTCVATNEIGVDTKTFEARVTKYLEEFGPIDNVYIRVDESKNIECQLPYTDPNSVRWYMEETYINVTGPSLKLLEASVSMDGNYSCRVSDRNISATKTYAVDVGYPPILENKTENVKWRGGNDEVVNCDADAKPWPKAKWLFNGEPVNSTDPNSLTLTIINIGVYTCEVSNVHGSIMKNITVTASVCIISKKKDSKLNSPLVLTRPYPDESKLVWPELESAGDSMIIEAEDTVTLLCPSNDENNNQFLKFPGVNEIDVICDHEDIFNINDSSYHLSELNCKETIKPVIVRTGKRCLNNDTEWLLVGFKAPIFLNVYKVCYDTLNGMPVITNSIMFNTNYMGPSVDQDWYIDDRFEMGNEAYNCNENTTSCCYAKQPFVNALDVTYGPSQISTYTDHVNSIPVWQSCSTSKRVTWGQIEQAVRDQLQMEDVLNVWSGGSHFVEDELGGMVPRYLWKVVLLDESNTVAVVYVNDQNPNVADILCKNTCEDRMISKLPCDDKYTYTCDFKDFLKGFNLTEEDIAF
ncbi:hypothetical protein K1T71_011786 [Dendrolimus kikuchii]|uniref:Uncharacterized protein n=1 Tax=Dendrolimus kikuchii TaxID=765133 RepID=A0ACC1CME3_9NEOP|nr:hypothetical protein K1T71_011786 [Dendrolimus kikuchii]